MLLSVEESFFVWNLTGEQVNYRLQQSWNAGFDHRGPQDFEDPAVKRFAPYKCVAGNLLIVLVLSAAWILATFEIAEKTTQSSDTETMVQRAMGDLGTLVKRTFEIWAERDLFIIDRALGPGGLGTSTQSSGSASVAWTGALAPQLAKAKLRRRIFDPSAENNSKSAFEVGHGALDGLRAVTLVKAAQLIAISEAEGIELRLNVGYGGRLHPPDVMVEFGTVRSFSAHKTGLAFDVAVVRDKKLDYGPSEELSRVGAIGRALGLKWGGDFPRNKAWPHFEVPGHRETLIGLGASGKRAWRRRITDPGAR